VGVQALGQDCILTLSGGFFVPQGTETRVSAEARRDRLAKLRALKPKERKRELKKRKLTPLRCLRYKVITHLFMVRYLRHFCLIGHIFNLDLIIRGLTSRILRYVREFLRGPRAGRLERGGRLLTPRVLTLTNKVATYNTRRAVKRRVSRLLRVRPR